MRASELIGMIEKQQGFEDDPEVMLWIDHGPMAIPRPIMEISVQPSGVLTFASARLEPPRKEPDYPQWQSVSVGRPVTVDALTIRCLRELAADIESGAAEVSSVTEDDGFTSVEGRTVFSGIVSLSIEARYLATIQAQTKPEFADNASRAI